MAVMTPLTDIPWPPPTISGTRVGLRPASDRDHPVLIELLTSPEVRRHLGGPLTPSDTSARLSEPLGNVPGSFVIALGGDDTTIGTVGFDRRDPARPGHARPSGEELEISFSLLPKYWGRGLATDALRLAMQWAAEVLDDLDVIACTQAANGRSLRLLSRLDFTPATYFREFDAAQVLLTRDLAKPFDGTTAREPRSV
jgi:RimJ/RimL family protein N-acetyltransferase